MAYNAPNKGERLVCQKDNVGLFATANPKAEQLKVNTTRAGDRELRGFRKGEIMGSVLDDEPVIGADGKPYLKIVYVLYGFVKQGIFGEGFYAPEPHEAYVLVSDEPDGWIRESWREAAQERDQQQTAADEVTAYFSGLSGVPKPTSVYEKTVGDKTSTWLDFPNGYSVEFEAFKKLSPATKITNTTRDPLKPAVLTDPLVDPLIGTKKTDEKPTLFTTTNILLAIGITALLAVIAVLVLKKPKK